MHRWFSETEPARVPGAVPGGGGPALVFDVQCGTVGRTWGRVAREIHPVVPPSAQAGFMDQMRGKGVK